MSDSVRPHRWQPMRLPRPWDSPGKNTGLGCHFLLQRMKVKVRLLSRVRLLETPWTAEPRLLRPWDLPGKSKTIFDRDVSQFSLLQSRCSGMSDSLRPYGLQDARLPCLSPNHRACSNSCPLSQWCHPTTSSSVIPLSSHLQSFSVSGSFQMSLFFASGSQSIGVSASVSILTMNIQNWLPFGWTHWISLQSKGLSRVFNTTVQKHQFFSAQLSSQKVMKNKKWLRNCFRWKEIKTWWLNVDPGSWKWILDQKIILLLLQRMLVEQLAKFEGCLLIMTLCNPMDCSPSGFSAHRICQARILEWIATPFSRRSSQLRYRNWVSHTAGSFP